MFYTINADNIYFQGATCRASYVDIIFLFKIFQILEEYQMNVDIKFVKGTICRVSFAEIFVKGATCTVSNVDLFV